MSVRDVDGDRLLELINADRTDVLGLEWLKFIAKDSRDAVFQLAQDVQAGRCGFYQERLVGNQGDRIYIDIRTMLTLGVHGTVEGAAVITDVTRRESARTHIDLRNIS